MKQNSPQPKWSILYLLLPVYILLAWLFTQLGLTGTALGVAQFGTLVLIFVLAYLWINENQTALLRTEEELAPVENAPAEPGKEGHAGRVLLWQAGKALLAALIVLGITLVMSLIGRNLLGEGVITLLYLAPIGWITVRWGRIAGTAASLTAALCFDYFFLTPYYTFNINSLEGWLLLLLFMAASNLVVGKVKALFAQARNREKENGILYELVALMSGSPTREEIADFIQNAFSSYYQAAEVKVVFFKRGNQPSVMRIRQGELLPPFVKLPERTLPIYVGWELVGKITIGQAALPLPADDAPLLQSFSHLVALAVERAQDLAPRSDTGDQPLADRSAA